MNKLDDKTIESFRQQINRTVSQNEASGIKVLAFQFHVSKQLYEQLGDKIHIDQHEIEVIPNSEIESRKDGSGYVSDIWIVATKWLDSWDGQIHEREVTELPEYGVNSHLN